MHPSSLLHCTMALWWRRFACIFFGHPPYLPGSIGFSPLAEVLLLALLCGLGAAAGPFRAEHGGTAACIVSWFVGDSPKRWVS